MTISEFREQFFVLVEKANAIVITSHISPDDDSIGSVLATYTILSEKYPQKNIRILYTGQRVARYSVFHNFEKIEWVDDIANHLEGIDTLITLDASNWRRFTKHEEKLAAVPVRLGLDHHASESDDYTLLLHRKEFSSNTELLYRALIEGGSLSKEIAEYILLGVLGDTSNFAYVAPNRTEVFLLGKMLVEVVGIPIDQFRSRYGGIPLRIIPLLQELVKNTAYTTIDTWPPVQYSFISRATMEAQQYSDEDMSAASHIYMGQYLPRVEGYGWGFVVTPRNDGGCRQSGRSLPASVNVRDFHERLGIGSGHDRAAGGYVSEPEPNRWIEQTLSWMRDNKPLIG